MSEQHSTPDVLARRLDQALPPGTSFTPPTTPDPLVNTAREIAKLSAPTLTSAASSRIEAQMLAAFDQQHQPRIVPRSPRQTSGIFTRWAIAACAAFVLLFAGLTPSVSAAVPGEPLYAVKQLYERVELATAFSPSAQVTVYLRHANRRAEEALMLLERNQFDPALTNSALSDITEARKSASIIQKSVLLRGRLYQADLLLAFVLENAYASGLTSGDEYLALSQEVEQIGTSDLLPPSENPGTGALDEITPKPTEMTATVEVTAESSAESTAEATDEDSFPVSVGATPTCEHGSSCYSQGVPGGVIIKPTPRPTNVHRGSESSPPSNSASSNGGGNGNGNSSGNGNSDGGGNSSGGNSSGNGNGNSGGGGNSSGGNGNGNGKENNG